MLICGRIPFFSEKLSHAPQKAIKTGPTSVVNALTSINRSFVENKSIFNIISTEAHNSHDRILSCWDLVKLDQLNRLETGNREGHFSVSI